MSERCTNNLNKQWRVPSDGKLSTSSDKAFDSLMQKALHALGIAPKRVRLDEALKHMNSLDVVRERSMKTQFIPGPKRYHRILPISFLLLSLAIASPAGAGYSAVAESDGVISTPTRGKPSKPTGAEIRLEFYPTGPYDDSVVPIFMVIGQDGRAHALRYGLRDPTKNVAAYEGVLPEAEVQRLFARVNGAFRLPKHRKDYDRRLVYESDGFYLAVSSHNAKVKEMFGAVETRPEEVRALVTEMSDLWKRLSEVPPAYAYLTSRSVEKDRLRRLKREGPSRLTSIESLPAFLQSLLISVVTQPRNFYPLTQEQYNQIQTYKRPMTYRGAGYELTIILAAKETKLKK
jgi:hypothetical protein